MRWFICCSLNTGTKEAYAYYFGAKLLVKQMRSNWWCSDVMALGDTSICVEGGTVFISLVSVIFSFIFLLIIRSCFLLGCFWKLFRVLLCNLRILLKLLYWVLMTGFDLFIMRASLMYSRFLSSSLSIILVLLVRISRLIFVLWWSNRQRWRQKTTVHKRNSHYK